MAETKNRHVFFPVIKGEPGCGVALRVALNIGFTVTTKIPSEMGVAPHYKPFDL